MRDIEFRAYHPEKKKMSVPFTLEDIFLRGGSTYAKDLWENREKIHLMEYIGLKDMDDTKIFEGDLIDFAGLKPIEIVYRDAGFHSKWMSNGEPIYLTQDGLGHFAKVIGNIYQNPELMK